MGRESCEVIKVCFEGTPLETRGSGRYPANRSADLLFYICRSMISIPNERKYVLTNAKVSNPIPTPSSTPSMTPVLITSRNRNQNRLKDWTLRILNPLLLSHQPLILPHRILTSASNPALTSTVEWIRANQLASLVWPTNGLASNLVWVPAFTPTSKMHLWRTSISIQASPRTSACGWRKVFKGDDVVAGEAHDGSLLERAGVEDGEGGLEFVEVVVVVFVFVVVGWSYHPFSCDGGAGFWWGEDAETVCLHGVGRGDGVEGGRDGTLGGCGRGNEGSLSSSDSGGLPGINGGASVDCRSGRAGGGHGSLGDVVTAAGGGDLSGGGVAGETARFSNGTLGLDGSLEWVVAERDSCASACHSDRATTEDSGSGDTSCRSTPVSKALMRRMEKPTWWMSQWLKW